MALLQPQAGAGAKSAFATGLLIQQEVVRWLAGSGFGVQLFEREYIVCLLLPWGFEK